MRRRRKERASHRKRISGRAKEGKKVKRMGENRGEEKWRQNICEGENGPFVLSTDGKMKSEGEIEGEKEI